MEERQEPDWLPRNSEMSRHILALDWSRTPLGPMEAWPFALRSTLSMVLDNPLPMVVAWGEGFVTLHNDAYRPLLGGKPDALGRSLLDVWSEVRDIIAPQMERAFAGEATCLAGAPFKLQRPGRLDEAFFDYTFSPVRDQEGSVAGILNTAIETTGRMLSDRRRGVADDALRDSEQRLRALVTAGTVSVYRMSADWRVMRELDSLTLATTSGPLEDWPDKYILPEDRPRVFAAIEASVRTGSLFELEHRVQLADGGIGWVLSRAIPIFAANGEIVEWFGSGMDVTERREAVEKLRESEERQAFLLELSDAIRPLGDPVEIQGVAAALLGSWLKADRAYYVEYDARECSAVILRDYVSGDSPSLAGQYSCEEYRSVLDRIGEGNSWIVADASADMRLTRDERERFLDRGLISSISVPLIKRGTLVAILCVVQSYPRQWSAAEIALVEDVADRTWAAVERAQAETAMQESEERFRLIVESARDYAIFTTDAKGLVSDWHEGAAAVFGYTAEEIVGRDARILFTPEDREAGEVERELERAAREGSAPNVRWHLRKDGKRVFIEGRTARLRNGSSALHGFLKIGQDVTERIRADDRLRAGEERVRLALEAGRLAAWDWDLTTGAVSWNDEHYRMQGYAVGEVEPSYETWAARVHPEDRAETEAALAAAAAERRHYSHNFRQLHPDGAVVWCAAQGTYFYDAGGNAVRMIGVMENVTERRQFEIALHQSEERFRQFADNSADALWIADATSQPVALEYLSPAFERIWSVGREEVLADIGRFLNFVHPKDRKRVTGGMPRLLAGEAHAQEYRIVRPDGEIRWILDTGFPVRNAEANIIRVAGIAQDITDRKLAEEIVRESRRQLSALVEGVPQLVWRAVDGGEWVWASRQWTDFTGQPATESHGYGWLEMVHPDEQRATMASWGRAQENGGFEITGRLRNRGGSFRWFQTRATPVRDETGSIIEWLGTCTDIDDLQRLQDHQKVLVAELQHRTRNLLAVVRSIGGQTLTTSTSLDDFGHRFNDRLSALSRVQGLLSRSEQEPITIGALVHAELDALGSRAENERIRVRGPDVALRNSTVQTVSLVLHELATNARKYGALSHDGGKLDVGWRVEKAESGLIVAISWVEESFGGPVQQTRREGGGYGRRLIERALPYSLNAETSYVLDEKGVRCHICLPLTVGTDEVGK